MVVKDGVLERSYVQLKNDLMELAPELCTILQNSLYLLCD